MPLIEEPTPRGPRDRRWLIATICLVVIVAAVLTFVGT